MLPCNVRLSNKGFTLIETLVIIVIVGVLAAIAAPSFLTWYSKVKINNALAELEGALKEAQREAIRKSQNCTVTVPGGSNPVLTASPTNCFVTGDRTLKDVSLRTGVSSITFNYKGGGSSAGTIVLSPVSGTITNQKCLVIAAGIGLMRSGSYLNSDTSGTNPDNCTTF